LALRGRRRDVSGAPLEPHRDRAAAAPLENAKKHVPGAYVFYLIMQHVPEDYVFILKIKHVPEDYVFISKIKASPGIQQSGFPERPDPAIWTPRASRSSNLDSQSVQIQQSRLIPRASRSSNLGSQSVQIQQSGLPERPDPAIWTPRASRSSNLDSQSVQIQQSGNR